MYCIVLLTTRRVFRPTLGGQVYPIRPLSRLEQPERIFQLLEYTHLKFNTGSCTVYSWYPNLADEIEGLAVPLESSQSMALNFSARSNLDLFIVEHDVRVPLPPLQLNNLRNPLSYMYTLSEVQ